MTLSYLSAPRRVIGLSQWQGDSPNAKLVKPVVTVHEEWGGWMIGTLTRYPDVTVELSFENYRQHRANRSVFGPTPFCYIGMWRPSETLYEFQMGFSTVHPSDEILQELHSLLRLTAGYEPFPLPPRMQIAERLPHELPVQQLPSRQNKRHRQSRLNKGRNKKAARMYRMRLPVCHP